MAHADPTHLAICWSGRLFAHHIESSTYVECFWNQARYRNLTPRRGPGADLLDAVRLTQRCHWTKTTPSS